MLELSVRERPAGGSLLPRALAPAEVAMGHRRLIFLLHGYNLTAAGGRKAYAAFARNLGAIAPATRLALADVVGILWPGDAEWGRLSFASFPTELRPALESALRVHAWLDGVRGPGGSPVEIFLVAHSLGSRVAMELLSRISEHVPAHAAVRGSCLMAAGVPVPMVRARLSRAAALSRTVTLYSPVDWVLHWAFPLGETLAREGWMPEGVGLHGRPVGAWTESHQMVRQDGKGYGHGDYWDGAEVCGHVARMLGVALARELPVRVMLKRALPDAAARSSHDLPARALPEVNAFA
jgi:hypothetical protein